MTDRLMKIRSSGLSWRQLDDNIMLLDIATSSYLSITGAGSVIWVALVDGSTVDELVTTVLTEFDVDHATAAADVTAFLADLEARGLLA
jgi:hypothetical protein